MLRAKWQAADHRDVANLSKMAGEALQHSQQAIGLDRTELRPTIRKHGRKINAETNYGPHDQGYAVNRQH